MYVYVNNNLFFKINRFFLNENLIECLYKINFLVFKIFVMNMIDLLRVYCLVYN